MTEDDHRVSLPFVFVCGMGAPAVELEGTIVEFYVLLGALCVFP
jgi:hypothetical protein